MCLRTEMQGLQERLKSFIATLREILQRAKTTPEEHGHFLAECLVDAATDAASSVRAARRALRRALETPDNLCLTRKALAMCQLELESMREGQAWELRSRTRLRDLKDLAKRRPKAWGDWATELHQSVRATGRAWVGAENDLVRCWREVLGPSSTKRADIHIVMGDQIQGTESTTIRSRRRRS